MTDKPLYRRSKPTRQNESDFPFFDRIDLQGSHLPPYPKPDATGTLPDSRPLANSVFDRRAAAAVRCDIGGDPGKVRIEPIKIEPFKDAIDPGALLEWKDYTVFIFGVPIERATSINILTPKCLAAMAYKDYFPNAPGADGLRSKVSEAIRKASSGWCGTFGPVVDGFGNAPFEGNYDMSQMFMLPLVYSFYDELEHDAREKLITVLLARGRIHRANIDGDDDALTAGKVPNDWSRAGYAKLAWFKVSDIPETENHVLMIATVRYLTNQLLYQRHVSPDDTDNRRNDWRGRTTCKDQVMGLLRNQLRNDFAEYNAKNYQEETRHALLNLCSYAYDSEVRLAARMVLDYVSAHIAVSSNDLRRMVPFRRRNQGPKSNLLSNVPNTSGFGFMDISLLDSSGGADPMSAQFALLAGNTRAYERPSTRVWPGDSSEGSRPWRWAITPNFAQELTLGAVSTYRLPPSIHDLFVNDLHRRFFQRLHRHRLLEEPGQQRNCDNMEIYAGSPSYLITAGGRPAIWVIPGDYGFGYQSQNLGVAVPISFMPTMRVRPMSLRDTFVREGMSVTSSVSSLRPGVRPLSLEEVLVGLGAGLYISDSKDLIQFSEFSDDPEDDISAGDHGGAENYGVAPDFACGFGYHFPAWTQVPEFKDGLFFVNRKSPDRELPGFFLAIYKWRAFVLMEAFDTWLHPEVSFEQFQAHVTRDNPSIAFKSGQETEYTTYYGNRIHFVIWHALEHDNHVRGSKILNIEYGRGNPTDTLVDAGNDTAQFLAGTVMNSPREAVVEITNTFLRTKITLDLSNPSNPKRTTEENGVITEVEEAGTNHEVWVDFTSPIGDEAGDFFHPFKTITAAAAAVADGGVIMIMPGATREKPFFPVNKRVTLVAPIGGVTIGAN